MSFFTLLKHFVHAIRRRKQSAELNNLDQKLVTSLNALKFPRFQQLKFLPRFLSRPEKWLIKTAAIAGGIAIIVLLVLFSQNPVNFKPRPGGTLSEGLIGQPQFINPALLFSDTDRDLSRLIYSSLVKYDADGNIIPDLSEKFEISGDGHTYTFRLKKALWHDGEPVNSADVAFTVQTIQNPSWNSPLWRGLKGIQVETPDDRTIIFKLGSPFAPFLSLLTNVGIMPKHIWQDITPQNLLLTVWNIKPIGSGPWQYESLAKSKEGRLANYTLSRNENYYGTKPNILKIKFDFYDDLQNALQGLKEGAIDNLGSIPGKLADVIPSKREMKYKMGLPIYTAVFFNARRNDFLGNANLRKALALGLDKNGLTATLKTGQAIDGPILPGFWNNPSTAAVTDFDTAKASQMISGEGMLKKDPYWQKKDKIFELTIAVLNNPDYLEVAGFIKKSWEELGVKTNLKILDNKNFIETVKNRNYEAVIWSQNVGSDPDLFPFWHSSQESDPGLNLTSFNNRQADALLEQARTTLNAQQRASLYDNFQKILNIDTPAIFLYQPTYLYAVSRKVNGVQINNLGNPANRFDGLENWFIKKWLKW